MLHRILETNNGLPDNAYVLFANTGKEHPKTLDFVNECSVRWECKITWLEYWFNENAKGYSDPKHKTRVVNHNSASRDGKPFSSLNSNRKYLPNVVTRFCTSELKINTIKRYMKHNKNIPEYNTYIGIRYDEPNRWAKALLTESCLSRFPMVTEKITKQEVLTFWASQSFDLQTPDLLGNCEMCFLKGKNQLQEIIREYPGTEDWWIEQERNLQDAQFIKDESYEELRNRTHNEKKLWDGILEMPIQNEIDCFCGD